MLSNETGKEDKGRDGRPEVEKWLAAALQEDLILASASPRRREILRQHGVPFQVHASRVEPPVTSKQPPPAAAYYCARVKAMDVASRYAGRLVLGADTIVSIGGRLLGKPRNAEEAWQMLRLLSGNQHQVWTGLALAVGTGHGAEVIASRVVCTDVWFKNLDEETIAWYIATGEPFDKAGGYGIQGQGGNLIAGICGSYYNVVGLPIEEVLQMLRQAGWPASERRLGDSKGV